ncbi:MAG: HEPN domain-containing protein [bacterium]
MELTTKQKTIKYWRDGAKKSLELAEFVLAKKHYDHSLFCGHLALEKLLKAKVIEKTNQPAPYSHDLLYLAGLVKIDLTKEQQKFLVEANEFNIAGRYFEQKLEFHRKITKSIAQKKLAQIKESYLWLSKLKEKN